MFKLLRKKTYLWIAGFLLISMAVTFFIVHYAYTSLLTNDFMKKQKFLAMQTTQTMKEYLLSLEEQINLLINKNQIPLNIIKKNYISLNDIHFDNIDFSRIEIYSSDQTIISIDSLINSLSIAGLSVSDVKNNLDNLDEVWYTLTYSTDDKTDTELLYIKRITHNAQTVGYLTAWIAPTTIEQVLSLPTSHNTSRGNPLFTTYSAAAIQMPSGLYQCSKNPIVPKFTSASSITEDKIYGKSYLLQCDLGIQDLTLILQSNMEHFQSYLALIRKILMAAYIIIAVLIIIFLYLFTLKISSTVNTLYDKMKLEDPKEALE